MENIAESISKILKTILQTSVDQDISKVIRDYLVQSEKTRLPDAIKLNMAFLDYLLTGNQSSLDLIRNHSNQDALKSVSEFYLKGIKYLTKEWQDLYGTSPDIVEKISETGAWCDSNQDIKDKNELAEKTWSVFFPEAVNITSNIQESIQKLRKKRTIHLKTPNEDPVTSVPDQVLITSNILLTIPEKNDNNAKKSLSRDINIALEGVRKEKQKYWYDHPVQIGVSPEKNEVLYGIKGLQETISYEKKLSKCPNDKKLTCVLSASVTHEGLHDIVGKYLDNEFKNVNDLNNLEIFVFTENDCLKIIDEIFIPVVNHYLPELSHQSKDLLQVFGVDGEYGRHYSFLKAIAAFWSVLVDTQIKATFKIDLDQVFPQENLISDSGKSAFEHLSTPLWGARGLDWQGSEVDLGMIAGALVNEKDIYKSIFTPDVPIPESEIQADEYVFFSKLPQAISTEAEMMARYDSGDRDRQNQCLQRVHVTGGTNGILVKSLFQYRPFTPSFFGRAEDQAFILSTLNHPDRRPAYVHEPGLIMRHDKEAFAQEAMQAAAIGKQIGDYIRILLFSAYAKVIDDDLMHTKSLLDPFTGCFISRIPITVVYLRFALKVFAMSLQDQKDEVESFIKNGSVRIQKTIEFINDDLEKVFHHEKKGWDLYYQILEICQKAMKKNDPFLLDLSVKVKSLIEECKIHI